MNISEKLTKIAENEQLVSDANAELEEALYSKSEGGKSHYDAFWDAYQNYGNRTDYYYGFAGDGWTAETLMPKYIVRPADAYQGGSGMFFRCNWRASKPSAMIDFSLIAHKFDFSRLVNVGNIFNSASIDNIIADFSNAETLSSAFSGSWGTTGLKNITLKVSEKAQLHNAFGSTHVNIAFMEGSVIGQNISLASATFLSKDSFVNIINTLSPSTTGKTATFKKSAKEAAFTASEWDALISTKSNWTISLV